MRTSYIGCTWENCVSVGNARNYAYGMKITERSWGKDARYQYNGKEQDKGFGRYNFDGRMYDERSCRWMSLDPQAAKYASFSPYSYTGGSPIAHIEVDGGYFIGVDNQPVIVGKDQDGKWVLSDNASDDLRKMVGLINNSKSPLAMRIFGIVANNNTKITFKFVEGKVNHDLLGLHQPRDKSGRLLNWNIDLARFDGDPEFIDPKAERLEYKEATISIFLDNFNKNLLKESSEKLYENCNISKENLIVGIFSHENYHDIDQILLRDLQISGKAQKDTEEDTTLIEMSVVSEQIKNEVGPINESLIIDAHDTHDQNEKNNP